jgi:hypothetical protein
VERDFLIHNFFYSLHIHFFSRHSLDRLLKTHGFTIHRAQQENDLKILAQWNDQGAAARRDLPAPANWDLPPDYIYNGILGSDYNRCTPPRRVCNWKNAHPRLANPYDVSYHAPDSSTTRQRATSASNTAKLNHVPYSGGIRLDWDGPATLPALFQPESKTPAKFWAK